MRKAVNRGRVFSHLVKHGSPTYNPIAKCRQKRRVPPTVSNPRQSANWQSRTADRFGL